MKTPCWQKWILVWTVILSSSMLHAYEKQSDGVLFEIPKHAGSDVQRLKIQICTDDIIRVVASPENSFSTRPSLMVNKTDWQVIPWTVKENGDQVEIATANVRVRVNAKTGAVAFFDAQGKPLLQEPQSGGKTMPAADVMGEQTRHIRQIFNSPDDEAFYGLGAHQNDYWNYKGHDVDLWQYNIVDVIPFLVSSRNYGILWDNNSRTKFGDIRDYQSLSALTMFGKDGKTAGLTADYYRDANFDSLYASRSERRIEYEFRDICDTFPEGFKTNVKAVRWTGEIEAPETGLFKIRFYSSSYAKFWIDGKLMVDSWRQNWNPWEHIFKVAMKSGSRHKIKIEWIHDGGYIGVRYLTPEKDLKKNTISLYSEVADQIDYYFVHGATLDQVVQGYRTITGKAPMMPKWAMGFWQCRQRYKSQDEILSTVKEYRKRNIPLDNIVQDWFYWKEDDWGSHDFDSSRFPDAAGMVKELHNDLHANIMISVWPKFYVGTKHYNEFDANGWLYKRNVEKGQKDWVGPGYVSTFYDPYSADARKLYWKQINEKLFSKGFDAWW
ncbi:MAG TPA: TIM-barrel domain-containing protein, partial [Bacteroidota bacterium]|nr:TIM-barrel domain-containing protein [Bacteroidota bacterium]